MTIRYVYVTKVMELDTFCVQQVVGNCQSCFSKGCLYDKIFNKIVEIRKHEKRFYFDTFEKCDANFTSR